MRIGLGIIARNEEIDLPKCLHTFLPHVDVCVCLDTGSTDNTMSVAKECLDIYLDKTSYRLEKYLEASDSEGKLCDFSKARNRYISMLEAMNVDYIVSADADDIYISPANLKEYMIANPADIYAFKYWISQAQFFMSYKLFKTGKGIHYVGRVHEVLNFDWSLKMRASEIEIKHHVEHHDGQEHGTARNMRILRQEIYPPLRSLFYWANENVDSGNHREAIKWYIEYIRRVKEGEQTWLVELYHCYWRAARWLQHLGDYANSDALCHELLKLDPSWSEAWCQLAYNARCRDNIQDMRKYAERALQNKWESRLFSEQDKYTTTPENMLKAADLHDKLSQK